MCTIVYNQRSICTQHPDMRARSHSSVTAREQTLISVKLREELYEDLHPTAIKVLKNRYLTISQAAESTSLMPRPCRPRASTMVCSTEHPSSFSVAGNATSTQSMLKEKEQTKIEEEEEKHRSKCPPCGKYMSQDLHSLCASSSPSLELVRMTLSMSPFSLKQRDNQGNLPLHVSVNRDDPSALVVRELLKLWPESARQQDGSQNLPLFLACRRAKMTAGVIKALLQAYPEAAFSKSYGNTALHMLVYSGSAAPECVRLLLEVNKASAATKNRQGNLPLHYLCAGQRPQLESVRILMAAHPAGITTVNASGETPISRALRVSSRDDCDCDDDDASERKERRERVRLLMLASSQEALSSEQRQLLKDLNWEARYPAMSVCSSILRFSRAEQAKMSPFARILCCGSEDVWRHLLGFL